MSRVLCPSMQEVQVSWDVRLFSWIDTEAYVEDVLKVAQEKSGLSYILCGVSVDLDGEAGLLGSSNFDCETFDGDI